MRRHPAATEENRAHDADGTAISSDVSGGEPHDLPPLSRIGGVLVDVAVPLCAVGPMMIALDLDCCPKLREHELRDAQQRAVSIMDLNVQLWGRETAGCGIQSEI